MTQETTAAKKPRKTFLLILTIAISLLFLWLIKGFIMALIMAMIMSGLSDPLYKKITKLVKGRTTISAALTVASVLLLVIIPIFFFLGIVAQDAVKIAESIQPWLAEQATDSGDLNQFIQNNEFLHKLVPYQDQILEKLGKLTGSIASFMGKAIVGSAAGIASFGLKLFICLFAMFVFLKKGSLILEWLFENLPLNKEDSDTLVHTFNSVARATVKGTFVIGIVQGGLAGIAFAVAGIDNAIFWSVLMAVLSIIPGIGTALIWIPAVLFLGMTGHVGAAIGLAAWCGIVVGTADNVLRPLLVGKDTQMSDLMVLLTTFGGLSMFGAAGIVLGPIVGALLTTIWKLWGSTIETDAT